MRSPCDEQRNLARENPDSGSFDRSNAPPDAPPRCVQGPGEFVQENTVESIWKKSGAVVNGWLGIPSGVAAEGMAQAGRDSLTADLQHGSIDYRSDNALPIVAAKATVGAIREGNVTGARSAGGSMF
jgi:hypothetical protein